MKRILSRLEWVADIPVDAIRNHHGVMLKIAEFAPSIDAGLCQDECKCTLRQQTQALEKRSMMALEKRCNDGDIRRHSA